MRLGDGGGRERLGVDADECLGANVLVDHRLDRGERLRRHLVDEPAQLLDVDVGEEVGPGGEQLAELDVRRAELFQRLAKTARAFARRIPAAGDAELREHAPAAAAPRDAHDVERATSSLEACAHAAVITALAGKETSRSTAVDRTTGVG